MRSFWPTIGAVAFLTVFVPAQPVRALEPAIEIRIRSGDELVARFDYLTQLVGQEEAARKVHDLLKELTTEGKGIGGIDPKKPFGVYGSITAKISETTAVIMVPIVDRDRFFAMLKERLRIEPEKVDDLLKAKLPNSNDLVYLRFSNGYLYAATQLAAIDLKTIIPPKTFFAREEQAVATAVVHMDRIADEHKKIALDQLESKLKEDQQKLEFDEVPGGKQLGLFYTGSIAGGFRAVLEQGKEFNVKVLVDPATDEIYTETNLIAKPDSALARSIAALGDRTSLPAGICSIQNPIARFSAKLEMTAEMQKNFAESIDARCEDSLKKTPDNANAVLERMYGSLTPTLKAGLLDVAGAISGPDTNGKYTPITALTVKDGKKVERLIKEFGPILGVANKFSEFTFDIEKIGPFSLHKMDLNKPNASLEKLFGSSTFWFAISDHCLAMSIEPEGDRLRKALKAKPAAAPIFLLEGSAAGLLPILNRSLTPDEVKARVARISDGKPITGKDTFSISISGGAGLQISVKAKGKAIRLVSGSGEIKGK